MDQQKIGNFIAELRKQKRMTQEELAEKLGVNSRSISRWENGKCMPDLSLLVPLSKELGISVNDLISGEVVDKKDYQEIFEENVIKTITKVDKSNHNWNIIRTTIIIGVATIFLIFCVYLFLENYEFKVEYNSDLMEIINSNGQIEIKIDNMNGVHPDYYMRTYTNSNGEKKGVIFVVVKQNILYSFQNKKLQNDEFIDGLSIKYDIDVEHPYFPSNYEIYYTKTNFNEIRNASADELIKIIEKSNLMYFK